MRNKLLGLALIAVTTLVATPAFAGGGSCTSITCSADVVSPNDADQCGAVVTYSAPTPVGTGCGTINCAPASGSFFSVGDTTVTCTAGAGPTCQFLVTVDDLQPPVITCPGDVNQSANLPGPTVVDFPDPTATDNCPGVSAACAPASGTAFPFGTTVDTCTATDASSNINTCQFDVNLTAVATPIPVNADLSIVKTADANTVQVGDSVNYTVVVSNAGPEDATNVQVSDILPAALQLDDVFSTAATCTSTNDAVSCNLAQLAEGQSFSFTISATALDIGEVSNTATVSGDQDDPNPSNNTSTATILVNSIEVSGSGLCILHKSPVGGDSGGMALVLGLGLAIFTLAVVRRKSRSE